MEKVDIAEGVCGEYRVERFTTDRPDFHSLLKGRAVPVGETFTRLMRGSTLVMSDTPAEMRDHSYAVHRARGNCVINGLGIGMVLKNVLLKPDVERVLVVEKSQEVIDLVAHHYTDSRVEIIHADALEYVPPKWMRFGMVWHDIWDFICSDNLPDMKKLHRRYGRKTEWQGSWAREQIR